MMVMLWQSYDNSCLRVAQVDLKMLRAVSTYLKRIPKGIHILLFFIQPI